jgi:hypothetical protein
MSLSESLIDRMLDGENPSSLIESSIERKIGIHYQEGSIRTFFDGYGNLRFCTLENVACRNWYPIPSVCQWITNFMTSLMDSKAPSRTSIKR